MLLTELTTVAAVALPVQGLKDHLRLGTGFSDSGMQDGLLEGYLRSAMAAIEGRIGKALMTRQFKLTLEDWRDASEQTLPVAPVSAVVSVTLFDVAGVGDGAGGEPLSAGAGHASAQAGGGRVSAADGAG